MQEKCRKSAGKVKEKCIRGFRNGLLHKFYKIRELWPNFIVRFNVVIFFCCNFLYYFHHTIQRSVIISSSSPPTKKRRKNQKFPLIEHKSRPLDAQHPPNRNGRGSNKVPKTPNQYFCPHAPCDKSYSTKGNLEQHVRANHLNTNYECPLCPGKSFKWASGLSIHKKKCHPGEKI